MQKLTNEGLEQRLRQGSGLTAEESAQTLIERFRSIGTAVGDRRLYQIFLGAKKAIPAWLDPKEAQIMFEAYQIAEKVLFPGSMA